MSKSAFHFGAAAILLASWLAVVGTSAANAGGTASGTVGTVTDSSSQGAAAKPGDAQDGGAAGGVIGTAADSSPQGPAGSSAPDAASGGDR